MSGNAALWKHSELNLPIRSDLTILDDDEAKSHIVLEWQLIL